MKKKIQDKSIPLVYVVFSQNTNELTGTISFGMYRQCVPRAKRAAAVHSGD